MTGQRRERAASCGKGRGSSTGEAAPSRHPPGRHGPAPGHGRATAGTDGVPVEVIQARPRQGVLEDGMSSMRVTLATEPLPHAASWLCIMLLLSSSCNFSNGLYGSNCSRKALMQYRTLKGAAAGHSVALITAASLGAGSCLSLARTGLSLCMETPGHHRSLSGLRRDAWRCLGRSQAPAENSWCGEAAAGGGTEHPPPFPCPARLPLAGWGLLVPVGDSRGTVLGVTATHSLSPVGHTLAWLGSRVCTTLGKHQHTG